MTTYFYFLILQSHSISPGQCKRELFDTHHNFSASVALARHCGEAKTFIKAQELHLHDKLIARCERGLPAHTADARKEENLLGAVGLCNRGLQANDAAELSHSLDHQHAGEDRAVGEVACELGLVCRHTLDTHGLLPGDHLNHAVHEKERVPVRKDFANLLAGKHRLLVAAVQRVLLCPKLSKTRAEEESEERADEKKKEGAKDGRRRQEGEGPRGW